MSESLNERMQFGHIVVVGADGTVMDYDGSEYVGESVYQLLDSDGQCIDDECHGLAAGWSLMTGYTAQDSYRGPVMHPSEYIGGRLARAILDNPGLYCVLVVDGLPPDDSDDDNMIGWAVAFHPTDDSKYQY